MERKYIQISKITELYQIDSDLVKEIIDFGLVPVHYISGSNECFDEEDVDFLLCLARLKNDFDLSNEALDIIMNMRSRMQSMQDKINELSQKLSGYEETLHHHLIVFPEKKGLITEIDPED
jgi:hypothetical protein